MYQLGTLNTVQKEKLSGHGNSLMNFPELQFLAFIGILFHTSFNLWRIKQALFWDCQASLVFLSLKRISNLPVTLAGLSEYSQYPSRWDRGCGDLVSGWSRSL